MFLLLCVYDKLKHVVVIVFVEFGVHKDTVHLRQIVYCVGTKLLVSRELDELLFHHSIKTRDNLSKPYIIHKIVIYIS